MYSTQINLAWSECGCLAGGVCPMLSNGNCNNCIPGCFCTGDNVKNELGQCVPKSSCKCRTKSGHLIPANDVVQTKHVDVMMVS